MGQQFASVDDYIGRYPDDVRLILEQVRGALHRAVPAAGEKISYQMPTITLDGGSLVYFAAWKHHIGLYPIPTADDELEQAVAPYRAAKDTVRFRYDRPIPYDLIERLAAFLVSRRGPGESGPRSEG
jgi:uncharacterized protein YdhG (YjbR/CyaY superfamily)